MRSAGCLINDYLDRNLDQFVSRTKGRPMATGLVTRKEGLVIFGVLITFSALLVLTLNKTTILLSSVGLLLATTYPLAKRLWYLPQFHLGLAFSWGIPMAFSAVTGEVPIVAWSLYLTTIIWTMSYDTFYAMVDQHDDFIVTHGDSLWIPHRFMAEKVGGKPSRSVKPADGKGCCP